MGMLHISHVPTQGLPKRSRDFLRRAAFGTDPILFDSARDYREGLPRLFAFFAYYVTLFALKGLSVCKMATVAASGIDLTRTGETVLDVISFTGFPETLRQPLSWSIFFWNAEFLQSILGLWRVLQEGFHPKWES